MKQDIQARIEEKIEKIAGQPGFFTEGRPVLYNGSETAVLVVPGFDDTAFIMQEYAEQFAAAGYTVFNTTMPGRGLDVEAFGGSPWQEWVESVMEDYRLLHAGVKRIIIAAFSTGATVALRVSELLAPDMAPAGLILLSPALFFVNRLLTMPVQTALLRLFVRIKPFPKKINNRHRIFIDPVARKKFDRLQKTSFQAVIELYHLASLTRKRIYRITAPLCIMQSDRDIVVLPYGARWLYRYAGSLEKELHIFKKSGHPLMVDIEKESVFKKSLKFIKKQL